MKVMTLKEYQEACERTAASGNNLQEKLGCGSMGISEEAGEVTGLIKKHLYHGHVLDKQKVVKELGDVLWYLTYIAMAVDSSLEEVARANIDKLNLRYPDGFSKEASINRKPGDI
jgi:NTP pyrophosphatase (non-canonical NTP hydrolase)